jgi:hypothetical protein
MEMSMEIDDDVKQPTPEEIRALLKKHGISREKAAALVHASLRAWHNWSAPEGGVNHREMPKAAWELLLIKLGEHPSKKLVDK